MRNGGDPDEEVFAAVYADVRRFAAVVGPVEDDPDDLVQEALARTLRKVRLSELEQPERYLQTVIIRLASNRRRSLGRWRRAAARLDFQEKPAVNEFPSDLSDLFRLPPQVRAVLYLVEVEGRTFGEAAAALGCSEEAARARASRGRRQLRADLGVEASG